MLGSYTQVGQAMWGLFKSFNWEIVSILFHNHDAKLGLGNSDCSFQLSSIAHIYRNRSEFLIQNFDETLTTREDFMNYLEEIKRKSRSE